MKKQLLILYTFLSVAVAYADEELPVIEVRADRTLIYPQRMDLSGEETLMDILMMFPDLMQKGFDEMIEDYNLRIDNVSMNGNTRLLCSQIKANIISMVQICDNTAVAKGTIGMGRVIDINLTRLPEGVHGFTSAQIGSDRLVAPSVEVRYGSPKTDIYVNTSYTYQGIDNNQKHNQYLTFYMTNWFSPKDRLLTNFTQQYIQSDTLSTPSEKNQAQKYLVRTRYFHNFNDKGTELLILGGYQYSNSPKTIFQPENRLVTDLRSNTLLGIVELNTPLGLPSLNMMVGWEGNWVLNTYNLSDANNYFLQQYMVSNNDIYLQLNYKVSMLKFTLGDRIMFYQYDVGQLRRHDVRNNIEASMIIVPTLQHQLQLAYHRKFSNPSFNPTEKITEEEWLIHQGNLVATYIDEVKLGYTFTMRNLTLSSSFSYLAMQKGNNSFRANLATYYKVGVFSINVGANGYHIEGENNDFGTFMIAPKVSLPYQIQIGILTLCFTKNAAKVRNETVYCSLSASKQFGQHWAIECSWHDIFSKQYSAALIGAQYRF